MLWSLGKVVIFLALIGGLALAASGLSDSGGLIRLWIFGQEFTLGPLAAMVAALALIALVWVLLWGLRLLGAVIRFLNGDETAISRHFDRNREKRGYAALSEGMIALAGGEHTLALARARTAERLLHKPELTTLLTAQAAEAAGDTSTATEAWKALLSQEETRFVAVQGLLRQKLAAGDKATALKLAERAFTLKPRHAPTQDILLKLQAEGGDWKGARGTLSEKLRTGELPKSVYRRRDALLALQEARAVMDDGNSIEAREAAIEANKLSPDLIPAAVIAARALIDKGDGKGAARVLKKAWEAQPHPELAAAYAAIAPEEAPSQRLKRFAALFAMHPDHEESRLTQGELQLAAEDFNGAKATVEPLSLLHPTQRALAILAAAERGRGTPDAEVRLILTRALTASRGPEWVCDKCGVTHEVWTPVCAACAGFDTLSWREPERAASAEGPRPGTGPALAPLFFATPAPGAEPVADAVPEVAPAPEPPPAATPRAVAPPLRAEIVDAEEIPPEERLDEILRRAN